MGNLVEQLPINLNRDIHFLFRRPLGCIRGWQGFIHRSTVHGSFAKVLATVISAAQPRGLLKNYPFPQKTQVLALAYSLPCRLPLDHEPLNKGIFLENASDPARGVGSHYNKFSLNSLFG
jgi:hypothetical protein